MSFLPLKHTNPAFNEIVVAIGAQLVQMFTLVEKALTDTSTVLANADLKLARATIAGDVAVNRLEDEVTLSVASALARYQPVAHDLHALMGSVKVALELERIADHAKNICRRVRYLDIKPQQAFHDELIVLSEVTLAMLREFIVAEEGGDMERAIAVRVRDKHVNEAYHAIVTRALSGEAAGEPRVLVNSLFIAKDFERVGDRIKNLTEIIHYQRTGESLDFDEDDFEETEGRQQT